MFVDTKKKQKNKKISLSVCLCFRTKTSFLNKIITVQL